MPRVVMVKKRLASGEPCRKCAQAEELLHKRGVWHLIDEIVWAEEGDSSSPGMELAAEHGVESAPFFLIHGNNGVASVETSALRLVKLLGARTGETVGGAPSANRADGAEVSAPSEAELAALAGQPAEEVVRWGLSRYGGDCVIAFSGAEDVVLVDLAASTGLPFTVCTIDTGRLHPETLEFVENVRVHYGIQIEVTAPAAEEVAALVRTKGLFSFYDDGHHECCGIRKVEPLRRFLAGRSAWMTGQRRDQNPSTRSTLHVAEWDTRFADADRSLLKLNPIASWTSEQVWQYIRDRELPENPLHERGFRSIGCAPCTRAVSPGQPERAGRWWWEEETIRECGLHVPRFDDAVRRIDAANDEDPNRATVDGEDVGESLLYGRRMSEWLARVEPGASEELKLAVRAQHLCRWRIPRSDYPEGRAGYKRWRSELARMHAELAGDIMKRVGYPEESQKRVASLVQKRNLKSDAEAQTLEDVACLVFLEHYLDAFAAKHDDDKLVAIIGRTWKKMSARGQRLAATLSLPGRPGELVKRALADVS